MGFGPAVGLEAPSFYSGSSISTRVPYAGHIALAGRIFDIDLSKYERQTIPMLRPAADQATEQGEQSRSNEGFWVRSGQDWSLGVGQTYYDRNESSRRRLRTSKGINVWERGTARLLYDTTQVLAQADSNNGLLAVGLSYLYRWYGSTLQRYDGSSWSTITTTGLTDITGVTTDGTNVWLCDGVKVMKVTGSGTAAVDFGAFAADRVWYANGRLFASADDVLAELDSVGASTTVKDHLNADMVWVSVIGTPNGVYAACVAGSVSEVYYIGTDTDTGALKVPIIATPWLVGDAINTLEFYGGLVLAGTTEGVRICTISEQNNTLKYGALIEIEGGTRCFAFLREFVWFGWSNFDATSTGLGRLNFDEFVEPDRLVAAHASDLMATGAGTVNSVVRYGGKTWFAVGDLGFYQESTDLVASGELCTGWIGFGDVEDKVSVGVQIRHEPLAGTISVNLRQPNEDIFVCGESSAVQSVEPANPFNAGTKVADRYELKITLTRSSTDATTGPVLTLWKLLVLPTGQRVDEIVLPLMVSSTVGPGGRHYEPLEVFQWLKSLEASQTPVVYQEGTTAYTVQVDRVLVKPSKWTEKRKFFDGLIFVRLLTVEI